MKSLAATDASSTSSSGIAGFADDVRAVAGHGRRIRSEPVDHPTTAGQVRVFKGVGKRKIHVGPSLVNVVG
jgi:hypothetical protein